jgi:dienelactone hydrolase
VSIAHFQIRLSCAVAWLALALAAPHAHAQAELDAIAKLNDAGRKNYRIYLEAGFHKVFILGPSGDWQWAARRTSLEDTVSEALGKCQVRWSRPCSVFSINNTLVPGGDHRTLLQSPPGGIEYSVLRRQPFVVARGPVEARGMVVWSHGYLHGLNNTESMPQPYVSRFHLAGYDVYRFDRRWTTRETYSGQIQDLIDATEQARRAGYKRIVLAGQSHGAWSSLDAAARGANVDAVIAVAPARHGRKQQMRRGDEALADFVDLARRVARSNAVVAMTFFANDDYDVGGRGAEAKMSLAGREAPSLVIDAPTDFSGHDAGFLAAFNEKFGRCLFELADGGKREAPCF